MAQASAVGRWCPACHGGSVAVFYEQHDVPVTSNRIFRDQAEARRCERGEIHLAFCDSCGFIGNTAFEPPRSLEVSETSQAASPRFREYATALARRWVERYGLRDEAVLEIGCGQGEFLGWMLDQGAGRGVGVDPVLTVGEAAAPVAPAGIEWIGDCYRGKHLASDVCAIVCRHTLEHIPNSGEFLAALRASVGDRDPVILFEVPDSLPIFRDVAFWDIYYEHCGYFSAGALTQAFVRAGFDVLDVDRVYDGQYLVLEARASRKRQGAVASGLHVDDLGAIREAVSTFCGEIERQRVLLQEFFASLASSGKRVSLWGAGSKATAYLTVLELGDQVQCVVDINERKQGTFVAGTGHPVVSPEELHQYRPDVVVMMNVIYRDEIAGILEKRGIHAELMGADQS